MLNELLSSKPKTPWAATQPRSSSRAESDASTSRRGLPIGEFHSLSNVTSHPMRENRSATGSRGVSKPNSRGCACAPRAAGAAAEFPGELCGRLSTDMDRRGPCLRLIRCWRRTACARPHRQPEAKDASWRKKDRMLSMPNCKWLRAGRSTEGVLK